MKKETSPRKVNIETYFNQFCEESDTTVEIQKVNRLFNSHKGNLALLNNLKKSEEILTPYKRDKPEKSVAKNLDLNDLKKAGQAVVELNQQIKKAVTMQEIEENPVMINSEAKQEVKQGKLKWLIKVAAVSVLISAVLDMFPLIMDVCASAKKCSQIQTMTLNHLTDLTHVTEKVNNQTLVQDGSNEDDATFSLAINNAAKAAALTQTAKTTKDWQNVEKYWSKSIQALEQIPEDSPLREKVDSRLDVYRKNKLYARGEFDTFREAVNAAEEASEIVNQAHSPEEWRAAVERWREALDLMYMVSIDSPNYDIAQNKLAEYALKFAYTQNSYLDSVVQDAVSSLTLN